MNSTINVTVWNEFRHEKDNGIIQSVYPKGIHQAIADGLSQHADLVVRTATLDEPEHGLTAEVLDQTDVLLWWGHMAHGEVSDAIVDRVQKRVLEGMGLIVLHSGHYSKIFRRLMGTNCSLTWREAGDKERVWNLQPGHPITEGIGRFIEIPQHEMYGERFDIPEPEKLIFVSWYSGGEVFRSGCTWQRGHGRVFYFSPGHESYPVYFDPQIQRVLVNAVRWARATVRIPDVCPMVEAVETPVAR